ncbi:helix-turn-helix domain-containing protein [Euzebya sp.]|uniref:helix-turn-helix domain-containing protein n=1 Tax=Euzebya sp. TaxID=1971409 RepID=UPI00351247E4
MPWATTTELPGSASERTLALTVEELCEQLPAIREVLHLRQVDLAEQLGVHQSTVSDWERRDSPAIPSRHNERLLRRFLAEAFMREAVAA